MRTATFIAIALGAVGCTTTPGTPITLTGTQRSIVEQGVRAALKDPDSAKFGGPVAAARAADGDVTACGFVNAKNSYGGYVGSSPYIAKLRGTVIVDSTTGSGSEADTIALMCRSAGAAL